MVIVGLVVVVVVGLEVIVGLEVVVVGLVFKENPRVGVGSVLVAVWVAPVAVVFSSGASVRAE